MADKQGFIDNNGKILGKISVLDLLVVLLILVVAAGTVYRFTSGATTRFGAGSATIDYTIRISDVREFTVDYYEAGMRVYDRMTNQFIGRITDFEVYPHYAVRHLFDGTLAEIPAPGRVDIYLHIRANGRITDTAIYVEGNYEITTGSLVTINTKYVEVGGRIYEIDTSQNGR